MMEMKRIFKGVGGLAAIMLACHGQAVERHSASHAPINAQTQYSGRIIVKYKDSTSTTLSAQQKTAQMASILARVSRDTGASLVEQRELLTGARLIEVKQATTKAQMATLIHELEADSQVEYAEAEIMHYPAMVPNDSRYNEQWSLFDGQPGINMPAAWDMATGEGVVVAVIDSGYLPHQDLVDNILPGFDVISNSNFSGDGDGIDNDATDVGDWADADTCYTGQEAYGSSWHGTHVAGTIAALTNNDIGVAGVAYKAKILPLRALGTCGGSTSDIADAIVWAAGAAVSADFPVNPTPAKVINMSFGGLLDACSFTMQNAIDVALAKGVTLVVAAGNYGLDAKGMEPANCRGVISVAATDREGGRAYYSNYGEVVDIAAPGGGSAEGANPVLADRILSTLNEGKKAATQDSYAYYEGTSMAAPHVAGVAALLYSLKSDLTPQEVKNILTSSAQPFIKQCDECGAGFLDAKEALVRLQNGQYDGQADQRPSEPLENGVVQENIQLSTGQELYYTIEVPSGVSSLSVMTQGGKGDTDLYVRAGSQPTLANFDCYSIQSGNEESCTLTSPVAGTYHIMLYGYVESSGVSLKATYSD